MAPDTSADPGNPNVDVTVTFNPVREPSRVTFSMNDTIHFHTARGTVTFQLEVATALRVRFPSNPIQWVDGARSLNPIDPPSVARVSRLSDHRIEIEINALPGDQTYSFFVLVQTTDGRFFGSDPTIVTMRPGDGGN